MDDRTLKRIFGRLERLDRRSLTRSIGIVIDTTPDVLVRIGGATHTNPPMLDSYTPTNGDKVYITRSGGDLLVHGKIT